ncbi:MAG: L-rhamnose mutarotase [Lachnospiraceae bacterium]|nr:L-rhamnose mutarotase [Lachnospiraceae bacterium]
MERHAFAYSMGIDSFNAFRAELGRIWPDITAILDHAGAQNFSLWEIGHLVFGYYETEEGSISLSEEDKARYDQIMAALGKIGSWISDPSQEMRLMYQDFGVVRRSKELIRHRVFATYLKPGMQEEYKARHDKLVEARGGKVTQGPDSNFSIWNAGDYIIGYNEIDVTMEQEETDEDREGTIAWETRMLEIMTWFTDDVDWITGERHEHVKRIAWHN